MRSALIVVMRRGLTVKVENGTLTSLDPDSQPLAAQLSTLGTRVQWHFETLPPIPPAPPPPAPPGTNAPPWVHQQFLRVTHASTPLASLRDQLLATPGVIGAYVPPRPSVGPRAAAEPRAVLLTTSFEARQLYLDPAPEGLDARAAWNLPNGRGAGVDLIDIELDWNVEHVELVAQQLAALASTGKPDDRVHGTEVAGVLVGAHDGRGICGFCPDATLSIVRPACEGRYIAPAIDAAASSAPPGSVIVIELTLPGPAAKFPESGSQDGHIPVEWWSDIRVAIHAATAKGIYVVEAAGNGMQDLDADIYDTPEVGFPAGWSNPFRRGTADSGAIVVGGGRAPISVIHGATPEDRSRWFMSNWGSMLDAQGWAEYVVTSGGGDLAGGANEHEHYTEVFGGTSAATAMVAGAIGCLSALRKKKGLPPLDAPSLRAALELTGSKQEPGTNAPLSQRIGRRPNLARLIEHLRLTAA